MRFCANRYEIWLFVGLNLAFCVAFLGLGGVFVVGGGGIGSLWVGFRYYGEIWQRNLAMVKNSPVLAADNRRSPPGI